MQWFYWFLSYVCVCLCVCVCVCVCAWALVCVCVCVLGNLHCPSLFCLALFLIWNRNVYYIKFWNLKILLIWFLCKCVCVCMWCVCVCVGVGGEGGECVCVCVCMHVDCLCMCVKIMLCISHSPSFPFTCSLSVKEVKCQLWQIFHFLLLLSLKYRQWTASFFCPLHFLESVLYLSRGSPSLPRISF